MKFKFSYLFWLLVPGFLLVACQSNKQVSDQVTFKAVDTSYMDLRVAAGDNFFLYSSGNWINDHPVPDDKTQYGSFTMLVDENQKQLKSLILDAAAADAEVGTITQKIGDFYSSGMDTVAIDARGYEPIQPELARIDALASNDEILPLVAQMQLNGFHPLFYFFSAQDDQNSAMVIANFYQGGLGLPDRDYYTSDDQRSEEIRAAYLEHIAKMFGLTGFSEEEGKAMAQQVMSLEDRMARASLTRLENRDPFKTYNKMSLEELQSMASGADWASFFSNLGLENPGDINVRQTGFITEIAKMISEVSLDQWKTYLKWNVINSSANYLSSEIEKADFDFYGTVLSGQKAQKPRWKRVLNETSGSMGEAIGKLYVDQYFPPQAKERMLQLVENLRVSLGERIDKLDWMTDSTKMKAHEKLAAINVKIGYPDKWLDYSSLEIKPGQYFENTRAARNFAVNDELSKIGKPYDKTEWGMTPQTVNAYYSPNANEIVFPAAILQPPFFFMDQDDAVNYGAIGVVIGHEMTHGFDDQGRYYDKEGNLNNWWTDADAEAFKLKTQQLVDQYNAYVELDSLHVDGELTLGENIADFGGLNISWDAFMKTPQAAGQDKIDDFTPAQRFFLSYAGVWRQNILDKELARDLKEDVHSPGDARVNVPLYNMDVFYQAFGIAEDAQRYRAPEDRAVVW